MLCPSLPLCEVENGWLQPFWHSSRRLLSTEPLVGMRIKWLNNELEKTGLFSLMKALVIVKPMISISGFIVVAQLTIREVTGAEMTPGMCTGEHCNKLLTEHAKSTSERRSRTVSTTTGLRPQNRPI